MSERINIEDYIETLMNEYFYEEQMAEMYFRHDFSSERLMEATLEQAKRKGVELYGMDDFDFDRFFYEAWKLEARSNGWTDEAPAPWLID